MPCLMIMITLVDTSSLFTFEALARRSWCHQMVFICPNRHFDKHFELLPNNGSAVVAKSLYISSSWLPDKLLFFSPSLSFLWPWTFSTPTTQRILYCQPWLSIFMSHYHGCWKVPWAFCHDAICSSLGHCCFTLTDVQPGTLVPTMLTQRVLSHSSLVQVNWSHQRVINRPQQAGDARRLQPKIKTSVHVIFHLGRSYLVQAAWDVLMPAISILCPPSSIVSQWCHVAL